MKTFMRTGLLGAAGLVAMSLAAHAAGSTAIEAAPLVNATATKSMQLAQRPYDPSAGSVGFSGGSVGFKKGKKAKKPKEKKAKP
jgi:hypothetical protein